MIGLFIMLGVSLNLLLGYGGLVSMAQAAFFGVGAYAAALSARDLGLPFPLTLVVAIVVTTLLAGVVTFPALRVREEDEVLPAHAPLRQDAGDPGRVPAPDRR